MTIPMIIKKVDGYEKKLSVVQKRLKGSFFRTLGDSIIPSSIEEGIKEGTVIKVFKLLKE